MGHSGEELISSGPITKRKRSSTRAGVRSVWTCSSSTSSKSKYGWPDASDPQPEVDVVFRHSQALGPPKFKWKACPSPLEIKLATKALRSYNRTSSHKFKLLEVGPVKPVLLPHGTLFHINFTAKTIEVPHAPERFFTELINSYITGVDVRLCISLGPINSISGDRLNCCFYCRPYNSVFHPKGGGFLRGGDALYKTVQDMCDINQNTAIPILEQFSGSCEPKKEHEYISEQVDDASLYATEALKHYKQATQYNYELVKPGFATRVILPTCLLFHVNFKAKGTDVATAPEVMFFAELTSTSGVISYKCCTVLLPSEFISGDTTGDKTNGCYYCHKFNKVRHPLTGGYVRGGDSLYMSENEFFCQEETEDFDSL